MFLPNISPNVHLRHNRLFLHEYLNTVILCICVYLSGSHAIRSAVIRSLQMIVSARSERRKGTPLRKRANKDIFRCLNTIWSIGIARRGLNELIFCENLKFDQNQHLSLLLPVTLKISLCAFRLILPAMGRGSRGAAFEVWYK